MLREIPRAGIPINYEELKTIIKKLSMRELVDGDDIEKFENNFGDYVGSKCALSVNKARTGLMVALQALSLKPREEVIVPAFTCPIVFEVVLRLGLKPVLVDVDPTTYNIDPELVRKAVSSKSKVVVPIHMFGYPCDIAPIVEIAEQHELYVIENVAQALGAEYMKNKVGTYGDISVFSFGPGKNITSGQGGIITIKNDDLIQKVTNVQANLLKPDIKDVVSSIRNILGMYVFSTPYLYWLIEERVEAETQEEDTMTMKNLMTLMHEHKDSLYPTVQLKKMPNVCAAVADVQLKKIEKINQERVRNAEILTNQLRSMAEIHDYQIPKTDSHSRAVFTRYVVRVPQKRRDFIAKRLIKEGIDVEKPYHFLERILGSFGDFPCAKQLTRTLITLPNQPTLSESELNWISGVFKKISGEGLTG